MELDGVALIVGAGSGIGREVALTFASRGVHALVVADIDLEAAKETTAMIQSRRTEPSKVCKTHTVVVDTRDVASVQHMIDETTTSFSRIDYFVSTAGLGASGQTKISSMTLEEYRSMDEVHNIGAFLCVRAVLQTMLQQVPQAMPVAGRAMASSQRHMSRGTITILTSLASEGAFLGVGNYSAAKHAVKGLVQTAALENAQQYIRVNAVAPSYVAGPMINKFLEDTPTMKAAILGDLATRRLADPEEVADAVAFLASASASYVNGHTLVVDGGSSLQLANTPFVEE